MKKIIRLTESDLNRLVKRIIKEDNKKGKLPLEKNDIIRLIYMKDDLSPIPIGTLGIVRGKSKSSGPSLGSAQDIVSVSWLNGRDMGLFLEDDDWEIVKKGSELSREEYMDFIEKLDNERYNKD